MSRADTGRDSGCPLHPMGFLSCLGPLAAKGWAPGALMQLFPADHVPSTLKGAIQLGIGSHMGNLSSKPERDVPHAGLLCGGEHLLSQVPCPGRFLQTLCTLPCMHTTPPCYSFQPFFSAGNDPALPGLPLPLRSSPVLVGMFAESEKCNSLQLLEREEDKSLLFLFLICVCA